MKNRIVLWGTNDQDDRVLIAMELKPHDNKVEIMTFPETIATEEFSQRMMDEWRDGKPFELPEGFTLIERELTVADSVLPEHLKVERSDLIHRAQTEWHFTVLSVKLHETYKSELNDLKEQIDRLTDFDSNTWDNLKAFWDKVQNQVRERNLFREQADSLRDIANELFTKLKEMRTRLDHDFKSRSKENFDRIHSQIEDVESRAAKGMRIQPLFEELKQMQQKFKELEFTRDDRNKLWNRIDEAFKKIKNKRSGSGPGGDDNPGERLRRRYEGLMSAIYRMQDSIKRDQQELDFQNKKIASTDGQLEAQIRQAKIKMVEERLRSKEEKLKEMTDTQVDLERRMEAQAARDAKREKVEEAKRLAEQKIREEMAAAAQAREEDVDKLEKAAEAIRQRKGKKGESLLGAAGSMLGEVLQDALDTARAVADVAGEQIKEKAGELKEEAREKMGEIKEKAGELGEKLKEKAGELKEEAREKAEEAKEKAEDWKEEARSVVEEVKEKAGELGEKLAEKAEDWKEEARETVEEIREKAGELGEELKEKIHEVEEEVREKIEDFIEVPAVESLPVHEDPAGAEEDLAGAGAADAAPSIPEEPNADEEEPEEEK